MTWESEGERSNRRGIMAGQSTLVSHLLSAISRTASHTLIILNGEDKMTHSDWIHQLRRHPTRWLTQGSITTLFYTLRVLKAFAFSFLWKSTGGHCLSYGFDFLLFREGDPVPPAQVLGWQHLNSQSQKILWMYLGFTNSWSCTCNDLENRRMTLQVPAN